MFVFASKKYCYLRKQSQYIYLCKQKMKKIFACGNKDFILLGETKPKTFFCLGKPL